MKLRLAMEAVLDLLGEQDLGKRMAMRDLTLNAGKRSFHCYARRTAPAGRTPGPCTSEA